MNQNHFLNDDLSRNNQILLAALLAIYGALLLLFKWDYLPKSLLAATGLLTMPFIGWKVSAAGSSRFVWAALALGALAAIYPSNMLFWFSCGFAAMGAVELLSGKMNQLPAFLLVVISPVFRYISDVWSFPIRLKMSGLAAKLLHWIGFDAVANGNVIVLNGTDFHVDAACMGLQSLSTGLLLSLLLMAYFERKNQRPLGWLEAGAWLALTLFLAISANFMRMLALVIFKVPAADPMHDAWGLLAIGAYVLLPLFFMLKWRFSKTSPQVENEFPPVFSPKQKRFYLVANGVIIGLLVVGGLRSWEQKSGTKSQPSHLQLAGFQRTVQADGVLKFENDSLLVYLKPPVNWLNASHDPRICWQGSGYEFKHIKREKIAGIEAYTATLENGTDRLYTCWWYDNGSETALDEWSWRWAGIFGNEAGFWLVNVTAVDGSLLKTKAPLIHEKSRALFEPK